MHSYKIIINKLLKRNISISIAESCTGGLLSSKFTSVAGISKIFNMGLITYSNKSKSSLLKISQNDFDGKHQKHFRQLEKLLENQEKLLKVWKLLIPLT